MERKLSLRMFGEDIEHHRLYLLYGQQDIVAAFVLCESHSGEHCVRWENPKPARYISTVSGECGLQGRGNGKHCAAKSKDLQRRSQRNICGFLSWIAMSLRFVSTEKTDGIWQVASMRKLLMRGLCCVNTGLRPL